MSDPNTTTAAPVVSAEDLRMKILEREMQMMKEREEARQAEHKRLSAFADEFMTSHVSEREREMIRRIVFNAVNEGKVEALVYSFPARLCTDGGRAINNGDADWPTTLQGKAKELYDRYEEVARPQGFKLKAMIINFPEGLPGDVGLFLNWASDKF